MRKISDSVWIGEGAVVVGNDITIGEDVSIWYNAVIRGDAATIEIGDRCNIQDCVVIHGNENYPVKLGNDVSLGHSCVIHSATIGDNTLIGMNATVMDDAHVGKNCIVGAGALVTAGSRIPDNSLVLGSPGKVVRELRPEEIQANKDNSDFYLAFTRKNKEELWDTHILDVLAEVKKERYGE